MSIEEVCVGEFRNDEVNDEGAYRDQRSSCVLGMFNRLEVKVLYPT